VKLAAQLSAASLRRRLARLERDVETAALGAAADTLEAEIAHAREREQLHAPLLRGGDARRRFIGADDPESLARELGSPSEPPAPWLAPSLPVARAPMRAAVVKAVARALSRFRR